MLPARCSIFVLSVIVLSGLHGCDALAEAAGKASRMHLRSSGVVGEQQDSGDKAVASEPAPAPAPGPAGAPGPAPAPAAQGVATTLLVDAPAGATTIEVASTAGFGVGDTILIGNVSSGEVETKAVIGFGSIILDSPLAKAYPAGTAVTVAAFLQGPLPTTSSTTLAATVDPMAKTVAEMDEMVKAEKEVMNPTDPLAILKEQLSANVWLQEELEEKQNSLKEEVYRAKLANDVEAVARETTPGVAQMLGDMRRQMHSLAAPFYVKAVEGQLKDLKAREKSLLEQIAAAEAEPESTTPPPVKKEAEKVEVETAEEPVSSESGETRRLWVICFIMLLGMVAICCVLSMRRRRNTPDA